MKFLERYFRSKFTFMWLFVVAFSSPAVADKFTHNVTIGNVEIVGNGNFFIRSLNNISDSGCYENGRLFKVYLGSASPNEEGMKQILSTALTAFTAGKLVDIYHNETQNCLVTRIRIHN